MVKYSEYLPAWNILNYNYYHVQQILSELMDIEYIVIQTER